MKKLLSVIFCLFIQVAPLSAFAAPLVVGADDSIQSVLTSHKGKRLTVRVMSGEELTGVVQSVNARVLHLGELTGREFFDAVVNIDDIQAVIVRKE